MNDEEKIKTAAHQLKIAAESGQPCAPVRDIIGEDDIRLAYAVQEQLVDMRTAGGERIVGAKIGLTSEAVQRQLGVDQPDFGMLFESMQVSNGGSISWKDTMQPKAEAEIAFVMSQDLTEPVPTERELLASIDYVSAAIEIVGSRIENWNIKISDTIADNASSSHFVLGDERVALADINLEKCAMRMTKNKEDASIGIGSDCLGSPLNALLWLAIKLAHLGRPLKKGDIVLSGALGPMTSISPGDHIEASIEGIGSVSVDFGK